MLALFGLALLWILLGFGAQFCFEAAGSDLGGGTATAVFILGVVIVAGELISSSTSVSGRSSTSLAPDNHEPQRVTVRAPRSGALTIFYTLFTATTNKKRAKINFEAWHTILNNRFCPISIAKNDEFDQALENAKNNPIQQQVYLLYRQLPLT